MISDDMDEDADTLDDDAALAAMIDGQAPERGASEGGPAVLPEWPGVTVKSVGLPMEADTVAWFKATHIDWRQAMTQVLRAWVVARKTDLHAENRSCAEDGLAPHA